MSLSKTAIAIEHFNEKQVERVIHLGDIIDGNETIEKTTQDLEAVFERLTKLKVPIEHVIGNHCLELGRKRALTQLGFQVNKQLTTNRIIDVSTQWRFIILDSLAMSTAYPANEQLKKEAELYVKKYENEENATHYNGGLGEEQTNWLIEELENAKQEEKNVIICLHHPVALDSSKPSLVLWNNEEVMKIIEMYKRTVRACFSGHHHAGGYAFEFGVHFVVFESILDSLDESGSFGIITLYDNRIVIEGQGEMTSRVLKF